MDCCFNCGKDIDDKHEGAVTLSAGGKSGQTYCSTKCFELGLKKQAKALKESGADLKKYIKSQEMEYTKKRIDQVRKKKRIDIKSDEAYYFFEGLSPKQKRTCALLGFGSVIREADYEVKTILDIINRK